MRRPILTALLVYLSTGTIAQAAQIEGVTDNGPAIGKYEKFEATFGLGQSYKNPFDPAEIDVTAVFISPQGRAQTVSGFYYQNYRRTMAMASQTLVPAGNPVWKVRFAPDETGDWSYTITAQDASGRVSSASRAMKVTASDSHGFIHVSSKDPDYFAFDDGTPYFPLGENMGWGKEGRTFDYDKWLVALSRAGGNYIRVWQAPWSTEIEWSDSYGPDTSLPGNYAERLGQAWELDQILDDSGQLGVYVMLCLLNHGKFSSQTNANWDKNPYNKKANPKGGFLDNPEELWTSDQARQYLKRNWRYLAARYACYTSLMSWEIFNEMEWTDNYRYHVGESARFHQAMADYLQSIDPYRHLVTTSYANALKNSNEVWKSGMQYTQEHNYGGLDTSQLVESITSQMRSRNPGKPFYVGEMGLGGAGGTENSDDPTGIFIHNTNWASLTAKAAGGGFPWWWDNYVDPLNLYWRWTGIANFLKGEDLDSRGYQPVAFPIDSKGLSDFGVSPGQNAWGVKAGANRFTLSQDGTITPDPSNLTGYVYSPAKPEFRNPPTFHVDMARPGKFRVNLGNISSWGDNRLTITLDGKPTSVNNMSATASSAYEVEVPEGSHDLFLDSTGQDWVQVTSYSISGYAEALRCNALNGKGKVLGRVESRGFVYTRKPGTLPQVQGALLKLSGLAPDGAWTVEWWDTDKGIDTASQNFTVTAGSANLVLPALTTDLAFKAYVAGSETKPLETHSSNLQGAVPGVPSRSHGSGGY